MSRGIFQVLSDNRASISVDEFQVHADQLDIKFDVASQYDVNGDGQVSADEFARVHEAAIGSRKVRDVDTK